MQHSLGIFMNENGFFFLCKKSTKSALFYIYIGKFIKVSFTET